MAPIAPVGPTAYPYRGMRLLLIVLSHYAMMRGREGDRIHVRRGPPVAQARGTTRAQIDQKLMTFAETGLGDVKALKGAAGMRLRSGDWRVVFTVEGNTITIHAVGHRREIYD
jgi:mRNA interferase RelE/StbE